MIMRHLLYLVGICCGTLLWGFCLAKPSLPVLLIDSAPSVVSYQGSSQAHTRFVIAPMGRSLGYVEPTNVNRTFHINKPNDDEGSTGYGLLNLSPVYVHH